MSLVISTAVSTLTLDLVALFEIFAWLLLWTSFSRLAYMSKHTTRRAVRWSVSVDFVIATLCIWAPYCGYSPDGLIVSLLAAFAVGSAAQGYNWKGGVPEHFSTRPADLTPMD